MTYKQLAVHKRQAKTLKKVRTELTNTEGIELYKERLALVEAIDAHNSELKRWEEYVTGKTKGTK